MVIAIITHTDADGVGAAGLYLYLTGANEYRVFFTEPYLLDRALSRVVSAYYERVVITDLGINPVIYDNILHYIRILRENNIPVYWYDHHVWEDKWIKDLTSLGVNLYIDRSTCGTGVVAKYVETTRSNIDRDFIEELVKGICAGDLWRFDHWLGGYYIRLVRRKDHDSWRKRVIDVFKSGQLWSQEFEEKVLEHVERELRVLSSEIDFVEKTINGFKVVVARTCEEVENSFLAAYIIGRYGADIAVLSSNDGKLSFRSRGVNVRDIALLLGGGGHLYASGAKIEIPRWIRILSKLSKKLLLSYILVKVEEAMKKRPPEKLIGT